MEPIHVIMEGMPPPELRGNARYGHWGKRSKKAEAFKESASFHLRQAVMNHPDFHQVEAIRLKYTVYYCGKPIDGDNLIQGMKYFVDMLTPFSYDSKRNRVKGDIGLIPDDSPDHVLGYDLEYQRVAHRNEARVEIEITEVTDANVV